jgi:hypothetical protein
LAFELFLLELWELRAQAVLEALFQPGHSVLREKAEPTWLTESLQRGRGSNNKNSNGRVPKSRQAYLFLSPNTDKDLTLIDAHHRLNSTNHMHFRRVLDDILITVGLREYRSFDAIGDWSEGVENSILVVIDHASDWDAVRYAAVWFGRLAEQRYVLIFTSDDLGKDAVYQVDLPERDPENLRKALDHHGILLRTLFPTRRGHRVVVYDQGRKLQENIERLVRAYSTSVEITSGTGKGIGGQSQAEAHRTYWEIIRRYEDAMARRPKYRPQSLHTSIHQR